MSTDPLFTIEVPGRAVSANARLGIGGKSRAYLTKQAREWRDNVAGSALVAWQFYQLRHKRRKALRLPLRIVCHVRGGRGDADNYLKLCLDGLAAGLKIDDRHFSPVTAYREPRGLGPAGVSIEIFEADAGEGRASA